MTDLNLAAQPGRDGGGEGGGAGDAKYNSVRRNRLRSSVPEPAVSCLYTISAGKPPNLGGQQGDENQPAVWMRS